MAVMGRQQLQRLKAWRTELKRHLCVPVIRLAFEGFVTMERLKREEAEQHDRTPFPPGTAWGACWEYGWLFADVEFPESLAGQRLILRPGLGAEQLVHVNGQCAGSIDREHAYVTLSRSAQAHQQFHLAVEAYAGHGARLESLGPCPPERTPLPEVPDAQCVIAASTVECWNEDAYQLFL
ncbi:MAG: alpha-mannosidase, partial [Clostridia bacterium]|nr:alpha-mannosidase [Clostridia bacterium]